ncbi:Voltage-gated Ion Channel (VIC) Superfamily [Thraustotheca clavata]|uniref:Voltage-gated Ion Channel (VIC) Superfamily n=1 Tax=Thraustotheca clavata TaxID=74557 RepID=A0A1V9YW87_9STRA|nr:Voltage-gated Ion Channel (VIC) Superfamily [Thraustotheca clavata]
MHTSMDEKIEVKRPLWQRASSKIVNIKNVHELLRKRYFIEKWMMAFGVVSVVAAALCMQLSILHTTKAVAMARGHTYVEVDFLRFIVSVATLFLYGFLVWRYVVVCGVQIAKSKLHPHAKFYHPSSGLLGKFLLEFFILSLHIPPHFAQNFLYNRFMGAPASKLSELKCASGLHLDKSGFCYQYIPWPSDQFDVIVFVRLYLLFRVLRHRAGLDSPDISWQGTHWHVKTSSFWFAAKYLFTERPVFFSAVSFSLTWICTGLVVQFMEHAINPEIDTVEEALWLSLLTMATVGDGSIPPLSIQGQVAIVIGGIVGGAIMNALLTSVLINSLHVTKAEESVIGIIETRNLQNAHHHATINLLHAFARYVILKKNPQKALLCARRNAKLNVFRSAMVFKRSRVQLRSISDDDVLETCRDKVHAISETQSQHSSDTMKTMDAIERKLQQLHQHLVRSKYKHML